MPQIKINKHNAFSSFAKILSLLDEVDTIHINYNASDSDSEEDFDDHYTPAFAKQRVRPQGSSFGKPWFAKSWFAKPWRKFAKNSETEQAGDYFESKKPTTRNTPAYKTKKFKAEKRGTAPTTYNKKWNPGRWYKKAWY